MALWLRPLTALLTNPNLFPSTQVGLLITYL